MVLLFKAVHKKTYDRHYSQQMKSTFIIFHLKHFQNWRPMLCFNTDYKIFINDEELESTVHDASELKQNLV